MSTAMSFFAAPAFAQSQLSNSETTTSDPIRIEEVGIEADESNYKEEPNNPKYTAPLINTPRSVTVVTEEVLEDRSATTLAEALRNVPGITLAMGEGGQPLADRPFIRGSESTAGILVDGLRDSSAQVRDVFNLEQVEVVRGASGPLAGRGAAGGSINLVTKTPKADSFVAGSLGAGNGDYFRGTLDMNSGDTGNNLGVRLNVMRHDTDIVGRDGVFDERFGISPSITYGLEGPTQISALYTHYESEGIIDYGHPLDLVTGEPVEGIDPDNFYGLLGRDFNDTELDSGQFEVKHAFNDSVSVRNISRLTNTNLAYIATNPDDSQGNLNNGLVRRVVKSTNSESDIFSNQTDFTAYFDTGSFAHSFSAGVEYTHEETDRGSYSVDQSAAGGVEIPRGGCDQFGAGAPSGYNCTDLFNPNPNDPWQGEITLNDPTNTKAETYGAYLFDSIDISEKFIANIGLRVDDFDTKTSSGLSNSETIFSYQLGAIYKPSYNTSIYASYATSASPAGVTIGDGGNNLSGTNEDLNPEKNRNYEVGVKWEPGAGNISLNAAVFRNEVVDGYVATAAGRGAPQEAIGEQRTQGLELSATGNITPEWNVFAGYSYLDSEIIDAGPINTDQVGNRLPNTPEHSVSLWTSYDVLDRFQVGGGAFYQGKRFGNTANTKSVDGYVRFDAMASVELTKNIDFQLNVNNLTDKRYYERVYTTHMATVAAGRTVIGSLNFRY